MTIRTKRRQTGEMKLLYGQYRSSKKVLTVALELSLHTPVESAVLPTRRKEICT